MENFLTENRNFDDDVYRNIVSLRKSENLFDDLSDDKETTDLAIQVESNIKSHIPNDFISRGFHYSTNIIDYPFMLKNITQSRYSDGSFPVWYGSLEWETSMYETAYHMVIDESKIENLNEIIIRERAVYKVQCKAVLIDLTTRQQDYPQLISENYNFTQEIGRRLHFEGHPGLLAPSARCEGNNAVIFNPSVLNNPRNYLYLTYKLNPKNKSVLVEREQGRKYKLLQF